MDRPTGVLVPETALGLTVAATFAIGLARDRREHGVALFVALPPSFASLASLVALARSQALEPAATFTVVLTVSGAVAVSFYAARYLRAGGGTDAVTLGLE